MFFNFALRYAAFFIAHDTSREQKQNSWTNAHTHTHVYHQHPNSTPPSPSPSRCKNPIPPRSRNIPARVSMNFHEPRRDETKWNETKRNETRRGVYLGLACGAIEGLEWIGIGWDGMGLMMIVHRHACMHARGPEWDKTIFLGGGGGGEKWLIDLTEWINRYPRPRWFPIGIIYLCPSLHPSIHPNKVVRPSVQSHSSPGGWSGAARDLRLLWGKRMGMELWDRVVEG